MNTTIKYLKFFLTLFIAIPLLSAFPQDINEKYNFGFESNLDGISGNWQAVIDGYRLDYDTIERVEGKRSIILSRGGMNIVLYLCLYQKILLPKYTDEISVSVFSKNLNYQNAWLKISGFDKSGGIIATDSVSIIGNNNWKEFVAKIKQKGMCILSIEIKAKEPFQGLRTKVKLWLDNISVYCDGTNLLSIETPANEPTKKELAAIKNNIPFDTGMVLPETVLKEIGKKKIIGFGETVHGSMDIDKFKYNTIMQLISKYNCRLVLFEGSIDEVAQFGLYVQGYTIDSTFLKFMPPYTKIDTFYERLNFQSKEHEKFINWVRDFNASHEDKVRIMGIDLHAYYNTENESPPFINRYISSMKLSSKIVDSLVAIINSGGKRRIPLQYAMKNEQELSRTMGNFNYMVLLQILKSRTDSALYNLSFPELSEWQIAYRDYIMWQNVEQVLENFAGENSPVVISSHYTHLNKANKILFNEVTSLGQYLSQAYGDNFYHIGILLGQGEAGAMIQKKGRKFEPGVHKLIFPPKGSLEYLASLTNQAFFYKSGYVASKKPLLMRFSGLESSNIQFYPIYFPGSMDGFVFIRNSTSYFKD